MNQTPLDSRTYGMGEDGKLEPPARLKGAVVARIAGQERARARHYLLASASTTAFSVFGIAYSLQYVVEEFYRSGFYEYSSLLLSDPDVVLALWKEFVLSLLESLPLAGLTVSLAALGVLLVSVRVFTNNFRHGRMSLLAQ